MTNQEWDAELEYCIRLVEKQGNISVPRDMVRSYLATMASQAFRGKATKLAETFTLASNQIAAGQWQMAASTLATHWLTA